MGRIMAVDFGRKRIGLAVSDPLQIIANGLETVAAFSIWEFLESYLTGENVETIVVGYPRNLNNQPSESVQYINPFIRKLKKKYPEVKVTTMDERFTSKMAMQAMIDGGMKKSDRRNKAMVDKLSAVIILQSYLEQLEHKKL